MRGFVGTRAQNPSAEPVDTMFRRAPLRRPSPRRNADGPAARRYRQGDRRDGGTCQKRIALSVSTIWHPTGCSRRDGGELSRTKKLRHFFGGYQERLPPRSSLAVSCRRL